MVQHIILCVCVWALRKRFACIAAPSNAPSSLMGTVGYVIRTESYRGLWKGTTPVSKDRMHNIDSVFKIIIINNEVNCMFCLFLLLVDV